MAPLSIGEKIMRAFLYIYEDGTPHLFHKPNEEFEDAVLEGVAQRFKITTDTEVRVTVDEEVRPMDYKD